MVKMGVFEETKMNFFRRGDMEKVKWMENLHRTILPNQLKRIQQNDQRVLQELVLPKWVKWDLMYDWANSRTVSGGRMCILCNDHNENGIDFKEKYICEQCFLKLKNLE
ncbi:MAG: hypothetical protein ABID38_02180 [Candidatus Diapherotrites archaeon]